jgi:hypothetical protein
VFSAGIPFGYQFSPFFRVDLNLGASRVLQEGGGGVTDLKDVSPSGSMSISYAPAPFTANIFGSIGYSGASGYGGMTRQGIIGVALSDQLSTNWYWNLVGRYSLEKSVFVADALNLSTVYARTGVRYAPLRWASVDLAGEYLRQWSDGALGIPMTEYTALLGITVYNTYKIF